MSTSTPAVKITLLGSTGSIGVSTLDVVNQHPQQFEITALTANTNVKKLLIQCQQFNPRYAVMVDVDAAEQLKKQLHQTHPDIIVLGGAEALVQVASLPEIDVVMAAIVGGAGLLPTLAAAQHGKRVLLANKEALVMSGQLFMQAVTENQAELLPIDSEHNAIFQCMPSVYFDKTQAHTLQQVGVTHILLTASGGPFRTYNLEQLQRVTPEQACAHPNWQMGRKISVDSATMMNKGLEVIEACWLFATTPAKIEVVLHPQSVIHSMVAYTDGSVLAQLGNPDMRTPIAHALAYPQRMSSGVTPLDLVKIGRLDFEAVDLTKFPCLRLAYEAMQVGGTATVILNAANEIAVQAFLDKQLRFVEIAAVIEATLAAMTQHEFIDLNTILAEDALARQTARDIIATNYRG